MGVEPWYRNNPTHLDGRKFLSIGSFLQNAQQNGCARFIPSHLGSSVHLYTAKKYYFIANKTSSKTSGKYEVNNQSCYSGEQDPVW